ncbi:transketolase C-terminal domain-containing protein [Legionella pneumophila]|uniref:transketolase C-terminal domain-containing protein n=1 Tax=Legionella pneumophila TaxID=446 RepID=UPI0004886250|nr:transketolase C-terminal domain-containing protein [Legionella pneumophila]STX68082.1 transketolase [Legionella pneumophila]HAT2139343.1 transketolase [Legionella pneumophila]HAT2148146.1 transketolase [Legionella pneumophila]HAT2151343.1 transketolase [Legionella pneumophila]HAT8700167.1 transketolase [Legionella pneumophila]
MGDIVNSQAVNLGELFWISQEQLQDLRLGVQSDKWNGIRILADCNRLNILYAIARAGSGHLGTCFSSIDIMTWLYERELSASDLFFSSKGHDVPALYAVLFSRGILNLEQLSSLRRIHGLPGHPDRRTPGVTFNTGSLGMGISKAKGWLRSGIGGANARVFVLTGDGELQEGQIWESALNVRDEQMNRLFVLIDHNKFQSDFSVRNTSDLGDLEAKFHSFGWNVANVDGHDFMQLSGALEAMRSLKGPKVIICNTIKGKGVSFMEADESNPERYRFHSGGPSSDVYARASTELRARILSYVSDIQFSNSEYVPKMVEEAMGYKHHLIKIYEKSLVKIAEKDARIQVLDADLSFDMGLLEFRERFSDRYIQCGIAEMDMVSQAGGLAVGGKLPICHSFSCFLTSRANEQIYNNATEQTQILYVGGLAGLIPAEPGHSHQSLRDIALMASIPGMEVLEPACDEDVDIALQWCLIRQGHPSYMRLVAMPTYLETKTPKNSPAEGQGRIWREGTDAVIICHGPIMLREALLASKHLADLGKSVMVISLLWLSRFDSNWFGDRTRQAKLSLILENHHSWGGVGSELLPLLKSRSVKRRFVEGLPECGAPQEVLSYHGFESGKIVTDILQWLNE